MSEVELTVERLDSPVGALLIVCHDGTLCALEFADHAARMRKLLTKRYGTVRLAEIANPSANPSAGPSAAAAAIGAYLDGRLEAVAGLPADGGGTAFQRRVWSALREIPAGTTVSYRALAAGLDMPKAVRAVASANARNPISIVVPCHRVIGSGGDLRGYSGGLARKRWLLTHEGVRMPDTRNH